MLRCARGRGLESRVAMARVVTTGMMDGITGGLVIPVSAPFIPVKKANLLSRPSITHREGEEADRASPQHPARFHDYIYFLR